MDPSASSNTTTWAARGGTTACRRQRQRECGNESAWDRLRYEYERLRRERRRRAHIRLGVCFRYSRQLPHLSCNAMKRFRASALLAALLASGCDTTIVDSGHDTGVDAGLDAGLVGSPNCPSRGGTMREINDGHGISYCIDQTEVTNIACIKWLDTNPSQDLRPESIPGYGDGAGHCKGPPYYVGKRLTYEPVSTMSDTGEVKIEWPVAADRADYPVEHVDWCDAYVFCSDNGKEAALRQGRQGARSAPTRSLIPSSRTSRNCTTPPPAGDSSATRMVIHL